MVIKYKKYKLKIIVLKNNTTISISKITNSISKNTRS